MRRGSHARPAMRAGHSSGLLKPMGMYATDMRTIYARLPRIINSKLDKISNARWELEWLSHTQGECYGINTAIYINAAKSERGAELKRP